MTSAAPGSDQRKRPDGSPAARGDAGGGDTSPLPQIDIGGLAVHSVRERECVDIVMAALQSGRGGWIATANVDHLRRLRRSADFRRAYDQASLVVADGMPLVWASKLQGTPLPERVAGSDLTRSLTMAAADNNRSVFFLGGNPGCAEKAAEELCRQAKGLRVSGISCPPVGFENDPHACNALAAQLKTSGADVVFVALGSPKQELFIEQARAALPRAWWIGVGISFSFVAGEVARAPRWMRRIGLEWLHRLCQEPGRLWSRYLLHGPPCVARLLARSLWRRITA